MDEPVVDVMADLLSNVQTVISNFTAWFTSMTSALISNPIVALMFGMGIALLIYKLAVGLVGKASFRKRGRRR